MPHLRQPKRTWILSHATLSLVVAGGFMIALGPPFLVAWWLAANLVAAPIWAYDKWAAGRGRARVPEVSLHVMSGLGGAVSALACMQLLRHKTRKPPFYLSAIGALLAHGLLGWFLHRDGIAAWFSR